MAALDVWVLWFLIHIPIGCITVSWYVHGVGVHLWPYVPEPKGVSPWALKACCSSCSKGLQHLWPVGEISTPVALSSSVDGASGLERG